VGSYFHTLEKQIFIKTEHVINQACSVVGTFSKICCAWEQHEIQYTKQQMKSIHVILHAHFCIHHVQ